MADAAAPAPELKEYPEFPGQKLSKRYVYCVSCCRCHHHRHHHHHHHHHRFGFLHIRFRNTHLLLLSHIKNTHKTLASTKKCSRDKKRTKKKPQKLPPRCDYWEAFESSFIKFKDESVEALLCFFFKKRSSFLSSLLRLIYKNFFCFLCFAPYGCCCWKEEVLT